MFSRGYRTLLIKRIISALFGPYSWPRVPKEIMIAPGRATGNIIHEESLGTGEDGSSANHADKGSLSLAGYSPGTSSRLSNRSGRLRILRCDESVNPIFIVINDSCVRDTARTAKLPPFSRSLKLNDDCRSSAHCARYRTPPSFFVENFAKLH